jgi:hypothetical protein
MAGHGLLGLVAWGLFYLQAMTLAVIAVFRDRGALLAFPFLVVYSLVALTESIAVTYNDFRWVLFVAFAAKLAFPDREVEGLDAGSGRQVATDRVAQGVRQHDFRVAHDGEQWSRPLASTCRRFRSTTLLSLASRTLTWASRALTALGRGSPGWRMLRRRS